MTALKYIWVVRNLYLCRTEAERVTWWRRERHLRDILASTGYDLCMIEDLWDYAQTRAIAEIYGE